MTFWQDINVSFAEIHHEVHAVLMNLQVCFHLFSKNLHPRHYMYMYMVGYRGRSKENGSMGGTVLLYGGSVLKNTLLTKGNLYGEYM